MRHGMAGNRLSRNSSLRKATVRDLAKATLIRERICTTHAKARETRKIVDQLITLGKGGTLADKRRAFAILCDHKLVHDLFAKTSLRFKARTGGYTRIIKLGTRRGDNAALSYLELTEKEEIILSRPKSAAGAKKKDTPAVTIDQQQTQEHKHDEQVSTLKPKTVIQEPVKKDAVKDQGKKRPVDQKDKKTRGFMGGIRNMFNRGSSSSGK